MGLLGRRRFLVASGALLAAPLAALGQRSTSPTVLGYLGGPEVGAAPYRNRLREELRKLGWTEGANLRIEARYGDYSPDRIRRHASELVALKPDVIVANAGLLAGALKPLTRSIPVVFWGSADPVQLGLVQSLAHPGGNFTGVTNLGFDTSLKLMELARAVAPHARRIGGFINPANPSIPIGLPKVKDAAAAQGLEYVTFPVKSPADIEPVFRDLAKANVDIVHVATDPMLFQHYDRIAQLAIAARLPTVCLNASWAKRGGLLKYGDDPFDAMARVASYVDRILRGANPADLPVEQPTQLELAINLKTAKSLGLIIPQSLLLRATKVIE